MEWFCTRHCFKKKEKLYRRLVYFFISDCLQTAVKEVKITVAPATDHSALIMQINSLVEYKYGPSFWKSNTALLNDEVYIKTITRVIDQVKIDFRETNPNSRWEILKYEIRKNSIAYSKAKAKNTRNVIRELESKLEEIENKRDWCLEEELVRQHEVIKNKLNEHSNYITEGLLLKPKL